CRNLRLGNHVSRPFPALDEHLLESPVFHELVEELLRSCRRLASLYRGAIPPRVDVEVLCDVPGGADAHRARRADEELLARLAWLDDWRSEHVRREHALGQVVEPLEVPA